MRPAKRLSCRRLAIFLISCLPGSSAGWALPAKMNCTGRCVSLTNSARTIELAEEQVGPLVRGKAAGKADREHVGVEDVAGGFDDFVALAAAATLAADAAADEVQQQVLEIAVRFPQFARIDVVECLPNLRARPSAHASRLRSTRS